MTITCTIQGTTPGVGTTVAYRAGRLTDDGTPGNQEIAMLFPTVEASVQTDGPAMDRVVTDMSLLPRELDPFESDWPWLGWQGPDSEAMVAWTLGSATFESDLQRALEIFDEG